MVQTSMRLVASLGDCPSGRSSGLSEGLLFGYEDIQGGFEELRIFGTDRQRNEGIPQQHAQGCVEPSRGLEDPNLPLSVPLGMQFAPASRTLVESKHRELRLVRILRS